MKISLRYLLLVWAILLSNNHLFAQTAPNISYTTPQVYAVGLTINSLSPANTGGTITAATYTQVTTFAGTSGLSGTTNATGTAARFFNPSNIVTDASGNFYVADKANNEIRKITPAGVVTTFVGSSTGVAGFVDATGGSARFNNPGGLAIDASGDLFVADFNNNAIRKVTPAGVVTTFAGSTIGTSGYTNATGTSARFSLPAGITFDASGNLYVAEYGNNAIRKITSAGVVSTFAGSLTGLSGYTDATGTLARFKTPTGVQADASGSIFVTDFGNNVIRKITTATVVSTFAGSLLGTAGAANGTGTAATFGSPIAITTDGAGNFYIGEFTNNDVRKITPAGVVTLLAGSTAQASGTTDATGTAARFNGATDMTIDNTGAMYLADYNNNSIRKITLSGYTISPALPAGLSFDGTTGIITGTPTAASAATAYTITAYNYYGSSSTTLTISCLSTNSWTAGSNTTAWSTAGNWSKGTVPASTDAVEIGVSAYTNNKQPSFSASATVGLLVFGTNNTPALTVASGQTLTSSGGLLVNTSSAATLNGPGTLSIGGNSTINSSGSLTASLNAVISLAANSSLTNSGTFTLSSDANGSSSIAAIPSTSVVNGTVTVQRYLTGGFGYRGYRLLSSPVYAATVTPNNVYSINYLQTSAYLTGNALGGFDKTGNPTIYLFREDIDPSTGTFTSGNFWGVSAINNVPSYNYYLNGGTTTNYNIPVGNGYMFFFRGNRASAAVGVETQSSYTTPVAVTLSTSGTLNQGQVIVHNWYNTGSAYLGYTGTGAGTNSAVRGFNLVGNPYPSSIDWEQYNATTTTSGIYANSVGNTYYELNPLTKNYDYYQVGGTASFHGSRTIASGQGFFVLATNNPNPQLIFNESAKTTTQNTGLYLFMNGKYNAANANTVNPHLRLQMALDSVNTDDIYIGFMNTAKPQYVLNEDAPYKPGTGAVSLSSISSDNIRLAINKLPFPTTSETINLAVSVLTDGNYYLTMSEQSSIPPLFDIWLMDAFKKDSLDMQHNTIYPFNITLSDTNSFGSKRFSLVIRQNKALTVHLLSFTATKTANGVLAAWKTENEQEYTTFTVERSIDNGASFVALGDVLSNGTGAYSFLDPKPFIGLSQYRLKQVDVLGNITYSNVVTLLYLGLNDDLIKNFIFVYPNPARDILNLFIPGAQSSAFNLNFTSSPAVKTVYGIKIVNSMGFVLRNATTTQSIWQTDISNLLPGTYVIQVVDNASKAVIGKTTFVKL